MRHLKKRDIPVGIKQTVRRTVQALYPFLLTEIILPEIIILSILIDILLISKIDGCLHIRLPVSAPLILFTLFPDLRHGQPGTLQPLVHLRRIHCLQRRLDTGYMRQAAKTVTETAGYLYRFRPRIDHRLLRSVEIRKQDDIRLTTYIDIDRRKETAGEKVIPFQLFDPVVHAPVFHMPQLRNALGTTKSSRVLQLRHILIKRFDRIDGIDEDANFTLTFGQYFRQRFHHIISRDQTERLTIRISWLDAQFGETMFLKPRIAGQDRRGTDKCHLPEKEKVVERCLYRLTEIVILNDLLAFVEQHKKVLIHIDTFILHRLLYLPETFGCHHDLAAAGIFADMTRHLISLDTAVNTQQVLMFPHLPDNHRHVRFDDNRRTGRHDLAIGSSQSGQYLVQYHPCRYIFFSVAAKGIRQIFPFPDIQFNGTYHHIIPFQIVRTSGVA